MVPTPNIVMETLAIQIIHRTVPGLALVNGEEIAVRRGDALHDKHFVGIHKLA